jgi:recombination protein RecT
MGKTVKNDELKNKLAKKAENTPAPGKTLKALLQDQSVKNRFNELLGKKSAGFISSLLNVVNSNPQLQAADPHSILSAAALAAALDLPIDPNLGFAYIVPYNVRQGDAHILKAQFQLGYKGYIQLAMRTGAYKTINATEVYEGEIKNYNRFTGEFEFGEKESDKIIGYIAYFKLLNGFEKYLYMTVEEIERHAKRYSKSYDSKNSRWKEDFHSMALKTVIKRLLSKYGILSIEMQTSLLADQAVVKQDEEGNINYEYPDNITLDEEYYIVHDEEETQEQQSESENNEEKETTGQISIEA